MKKLLLLNLVLISAVSMADLTGKVEFKLASDTEFRAKEMEIEKVQGDKKKDSDEHYEDTAYLKPYLIGKIDAEKAKKAVENGAIESILKLDLGFDDFGLSFGGEVGTQEYSYFPNNIELLPAKYFGKYNENKKNYVLNGYIQYKNDDIFLRPTLKVSYYAQDKQKPFYQNIYKDTLNFYGSIYHEFDNGVRFYTNADLNTRINNSKPGIMFKDVSFKAGASGFAGNSVLLKGSAELKYYPKFIRADMKIKDPLFGNDKLDLLKPLEYKDNLADDVSAKNGLTSNEAANGYALDLFRNKSERENNSNITLPKIPEGEIKSVYFKDLDISTKAKEMEIKYGLEFRPKLEAKYYGIKNYVIGVLFDTSVKDERYYNYTEYRKLTDEEKTKIDNYNKENIEKYNKEAEEYNKTHTKKKELKTFKPIQDKEAGTITKNYGDTEFKFIISPELEIKSVKDMFAKINLRTEYRLNNYQTISIYRKEGEAKDLQNSVKNNVTTHKIAFQPSLELDYTKQIKPTLKVKTDLYASYSIQGLVGSKISLLKADEKGEYSNSSKLLSNDRYDVTKIYRDKDGNVYLKPKDKDMKNYEIVEKQDGVYAKSGNKEVKLEAKKLSDLTYNEAGAYGNNLAKETLGDSFDKGIIRHEISLAPDLTFIYEPLSGLNINFGIGGDIKFEKGEIKNMKLSHILVRPHLGFIYNW